MGILGDFTPFFSCSNRMESHPRSCICNVRPVNKTRSHTEYMKKFYAVPENQAQLKRRIARIEVKLQTLELKIKKLEDRSTKLTK